VTQSIFISFSKLYFHTRAHQISATSLLDLPKLRVKHLKTS